MLLLIRTLNNYTSPKTNVNRDGIDIKLTISFNVDKGWLFESDKALQNVLTCNDINVLGYDDDNQPITSSIQPKNPTTTEYIIMNGTDECEDYQYTDTYTDEDIILENITDDECTNVFKNVPGIKQQYTIDTNLKKQITKNNESKSGCLLKTDNNKQIKSWLMNQNDNRSTVSTTTPNVLTSKSIHICKLKSLTSILCNIPKDTICSDKIELDICKKSCNICNKETDNKYYNPTINIYLGDHLFLEGTFSNNSSFLLKNDNNELEWPIDNTTFTTFKKIFKPTSVGIWTYLNSHMEDNLNTQGKIIVTEAPV